MPTTTIIVNINAFHRHKLSVPLITIFQDTSQPYIFFTKIIAFNCVYIHLTKFVVQGVSSNKLPMHPSISNNTSLHVRCIYYKTQFVHPTYMLSMNPPITLFNSQNFIFSYTTIRSSHIYSPTTIY